MTRKLNAATGLVAMAMALTTALPGCATSTTYSQLVGARYFVTNLDTYPVLISSVDGRSTTTTPKYVEPGLRKLVLQGPPSGAGVSTLEELTIDVKPCTRYYIVAVRASPLDSKFTPRIDYEMPLGGSDCQPR